MYNTVYMITFVLYAHLYMHAVLLYSVGLESFVEVKYQISHTLGIYMKIYNSKITAIK